MPVRLEGTNNKTVQTGEASNTARDKEQNTAAAPGKEQPGVTAVAAPYSNVVAYKKQTVVAAKFPDCESGHRPKPWSMDRERIRREKIDRIASDIMANEALKFIKEAYESVFKGKSHPKSGEKESHYGFVWLAGIMIPQKTRT